MNALSENRPWRLKSSVALFSLSALDFPPGILLGFSSSSPSVKSSPVFPLLHHPEGNPPLSLSSEGRLKKPTRPLAPIRLANRVPSIHPLPPFPSSTGGVGGGWGAGKIPRALPVTNRGNPPPHPPLRFSPSSPRLLVISTGPDFLRGSSEGWGVGTEGRGTLPQSAMSQSSPVPGRMGLQ